MNERAGSGLRQAEARMDAVYAKVLARISDVGKENLQAAQETWRRFRDQECEFEAMGTKGGSIHPMVVAECRRRADRSEHQGSGGPGELPGGQLLLRRAVGLHTCDGVP